MRIKLAACFLVLAAQSGLCAEQTWSQAARLHGLGGGVTDLQASPSGNLIIGSASGRIRGDLRIWRFQDGSEPKASRLGGPLQFRSGVLSTALHPSGTRMASGGMDGRLILWDIESQKIQLAVQAHKNWIYAVKFSADGKWLGSVSADGTAVVWDLGTELEKTRFAEHDGAVTDLLFRDNGLVVTSGWDKTIRIWRQTTGEQLRTIEGHGGPVLALAAHPDGNLFASASADGTVRLWRWNGNQLAILRGHSKWVRDVDFSPDGSRLASGGSDGFVRVWDTESRQQLSGWAADALGVNCVQFQGDRLISGGADRSIKIWEQKRAAPAKR